MTTFVILYRQGLKGQVLGWFGQFNTEQEARDAFPFPLASTEVLKIVETHDILDIPGAIREAISPEQAAFEAMYEKRARGKSEREAFAELSEAEQAAYIAAWEEEQRVGNV